MLRAKSADGKMSCGCYLVVLLFNLLLGGWTFDYVLKSLAGLNAPWYADMVAGLLLGQFTVPLAIVCWVLRLAGLPVPFFH